MSDEGHVQFIVTRPALERLIGGDSELEIKLRHAAAQNIANRFLKNMVNDEVSRTTHNKIRVEVESHLKNILNNTHTTISYNVGDIINKHIDNIMPTKINDYVTGKYSKYEHERVLERRISSHLDKIIDEKIKEKLDDIINSKIDSIIASHVESIIKKFQSFIDGEQDAVER